MKRAWSSVLLAGLFAVGFAGGASASPISMNPGAVQVSTFGNPFTITFDGGDTSDNILHFTAQGGGGTGLLPSTAVAAIVFDGTTILDAGDTIGGLFDPNNVVFGLTMPGTGVAAALLLDSFGPSAESFYLHLASIPTTATVYSLDVNGIGDVGSLRDVFDNAIDRQRIRFSAAIPEPGAALVFGLGLLITSVAIRRLR